MVRVVRAHFGGQGSRGTHHHTVIVFFLFLATASAVLVRAAEPATSTITTATLVPVADSYVDASTATTNYGSNRPGLSSTVLPFARCCSASTSPRSAVLCRTHVCAPRRQYHRQSEPERRHRGTRHRQRVGRGRCHVHERVRRCGCTSAASFGAVSRNTWVEVPVTTAVVTGGLVTLGVRTADWDGAYFDSRETGVDAAAARRHRGVVDHDHLEHDHDHDDYRAHAPSTAPRRAPRLPHLRRRRPVPRRRAPPRRARRRPRRCRRPTTTTRPAPAADSYVESSTASNNYGPQPRVSSSTARRFGRP